MRHTVDKSGLKKNLFVALALSGLFLVYVFQRFDYLGFLYNLLGITQPSTTASFVVNRSFRLIANDLLSIVLIQSVFSEVRFTRLAFLVFLGELLILLPVYLVVKLNAEGPSEISSPLYQPLHRMIVNPLLMIILIAGFYYQRWREKMN